MNCWFGGGCDPLHSRQSAELSDSVAAPKAEPRGFMMQMRGTRGAGRGATPPGTNSRTQLNDGGADEFCKVLNRL